MSKAEKPKPRVHIFDVDGPLYSRDLDVDFAFYLAERGRFTSRAKKKFERLLEEYNTHRIDYRELAQRAVEIFAEGIAGQVPQQIRADAVKFIQSHKKYFHTESIAKLRKLGAKPNTRIVFLSTSPTQVIATIAEGLNVKVDYFWGASYASTRKRFTGKPKTKDIVDYKKRALNTLSRMWKVPKSNMVFYGNALPDFTSSIRAGVPFVPMNPNHALQEAWTTFLRAQERNARRRKGPPRVALRRTKPIITRPVVKR